MYTVLAFPAQTVFADGICRDSRRAHPCAACAKKHIAQVIGFDLSTVKREPRHNTGLRGYRPKQAQEMADERKLKPRSVKMTPHVEACVDTKLREDLSPVQVRDTMETVLGTRVSHERIGFAQDRLNHRPRKTLDLRTPLDVLLQARCPTPPKGGGHLEVESAMGVGGVHVALGKGGGDTCI